MISMIISGGQTGACRAALDVALKFNIPHGGWIPKCTKSEGSPLPDKYQLQELNASGYPASSAQNVFHSDGTVIFSRGEPTGEIRYTRMIALQFKKHLLHIDLNKFAANEAALLIRLWIKFQNIKTLNVTGPSASKDGRIYADVYRTLEMTYRMCRVERLKSGNQPKRLAEFGFDMKQGDQPWVLQEVAAAKSLAIKKRMTPKNNTAGPSLKLVHRGSPIR